MAETDQLLIIIEDRIRIGQSLGGIDAGVIRIHDKPRSARRKAPVRGGIPLHGRSGIVPADFIDISHHFLRGNETHLVHILIKCALLLDIVKLLCRIPVHVGHADFFSLIYVGSSLHHVQAGGQHLGGFYPPLIGVISKAGDAAGLIMVVEVEGVPGFPLEPDLPLVQDLAEGGEAGLLVRSFPVFCLYAGRSVHVLKVEAHAKLGPFIVCIFL